MYTSKMKFDTSAQHVEKLSGITTVGKDISHWCTTEKKNITVISVLGILVKNVAYQGTSVLFTLDPSHFYVRSAVLALVTFTISEHTSNHFMMKLLHLLVTFVLTDAPSKKS